MKHTPPPTITAATARERYRQSVADALTNWRMGCISPRRNGVENELFRSAVSEILAMRLRIAYTPIFATLERMQKQLEILADARTDFYAPPTRRVFPMRIEATR